ncbi:PQQ-dependent sugar dehydrogenase [Nocardia farcinica]|uniref:PQQ-dependent sugar dehydrogenase n=1 Tax=Nocardia farcinica TaxID=37329 RepID=UPI0018940DF4|nr:PQQ-dependent sugar dehydrogenase [Nocardia farcinica]MBF6230291.1 PQQ-dependent sugar dehydrogenase [Nocardia farcinica]
MRLVAVGRVAMCVALGSALLAGCARFDDSASSPFTPEPTFSPADPRPPDQPPSSTTRPSGPCIDPDPSVVATCLDTTGGLVGVGHGALVAERRTGRILEVVDPDTPPVEVATVSVDGSGDGGLLDIALSPTYGEDGLIYAYITTGSDNRVVRLAEGGPPKDILTGIPKGATGNRGALEWATPDRLMVLTGDAGNPGLANSPGSLAGKLLRLDSPAPGSAAPQIVAAGIGTPGDLCRDGSDNVWFTDRTAVEDRLQRMDPSGAVSVAWTWPDRPGVAGCAVAADGVAVALTYAKALAIAPTDPNTLAVTTAPTLLVQDRYGQLGGATIGPDGTVWVGTVNKAEGTPGPNDDRVVRVPPPSGGGGGGPD